MLGDAHARACHYKRRDGRNVERGAAVAARAGGIEQRMGTDTNVYGRGFFAHGSREPQQFLGGLAFAAQAHQELRDFWRGGLAVQNDQHGVVRLSGRQVFPRGNFVEESQEHGRLCLTLP